MKKSSRKSRRCIPFEGMIPKLSHPITSKSTKINNSAPSPTMVTDILKLGSLYLERMPLTLSDVTDIPFPDVLHVHNQSLNGF